MRVRVEDYLGHMHQLDFDVELNPSVLKQVLKAFEEDAFRKETIVPDVWRYNLEIKDGSAKLLCLEAENPYSDFSDKAAIKACGLSILLLLLESPHTSEYDFTGGDLIPKAPAQGRSPGDAGGAIEKYLSDVIDSLLQAGHIFEGSYAVVIANPVPYHASLGHYIPGRLNRKVRNHIWKRLWSILDIQKHFEERLKLYSPKIILNCCTASLTADVSSLLCRNGYGDHTFVTYHPAIMWNKLKGNLKVSILREWLQGQEPRIQRSFEMFELRGK